jgi:hypothetical protein
VLSGVEIANDFRGSERSFNPSSTASTVDVGSFLLSFHHHTFTARHPNSCPTVDLCCMCPSPLQRDVGLAHCRWTDGCGRENTKTQEVGIEVSRDNETRHRVSFWFLLSSLDQERPPSILDNPTPTHHHPSTALDNTRRRNPANNVWTPQTMSPAQRRARNYARTTHGPSLGWNVNDDDATRAEKQADAYGPRLGRIEQQAVYPNAAVSDDGAAKGPQPCVKRYGGTGIPSPTCRTTRKHRDPNATASHDTNAMSIRVERYVGKGPKRHCPESHECGGNPPPTVSNGTEVMETHRQCVERGEGNLTPNASMSIHGRGGQRRNRRVLEWRRLGNPTRSRACWLCSEIYSHLFCTMYLDSNPRRDYPWV